MTITLYGIRIGGSLYILDSLTLPLILLCASRREATRYSSLIATRIIRMLPSIILILRSPPTRIIMLRRLSLTLSYATVVLFVERDLTRQAVAVTSKHIYVRLGS